MYIQCVVEMKHLGFPANVWFVLDRVELYYSMSHHVHNQTRIQISSFIRLIKISKIQKRSLYVSLSTIPSTYNFKQQKGDVRVPLVAKP